MKRSCFARLAWALCVTCAATVVQAQAVLASSSFARGDDGWTTNTLELPSPPLPGTTTWHERGGDPGAYISSNWGLREAYGDYVAFAAPAEFLGDMSALLFGSISFNQRMVDGTPFEFVDWVHLSNGVQSIVWVGGLQGNDWNRVTIEFSVRGGWLAVNPDLLDYRPATLADIRAVLADVQALRIRSFWSGTTPVSDLDEVVLRAPVPEPLPAALWTAGMLALVWLRRRCAKP